MTTIRKLTPPLAPCHACGYEYAGSHCPLCGVEHPTYSAIKSIGRKQDEKSLKDLAILAGETC